MNNQPMSDNLANPTSQPDEKKPFVSWEKCDQHYEESRKRVSQPAIVSLSSLIGDNCWVIKETDFRLSMRVIYKYVALIEYQGERYYILTPRRCGFSQPHPIYPSQPLANP